MGFTYNFSTSPQLSYVRLLIMDTDPTQPIFDDSEVNAAIYNTSSQGIYVSSQSDPTGNPMPAVMGSPAMVYSFYQAAAVLLQAMAANKAYISSVQKLLDVTLDPSKAAIALRALAQDYLTRDDNQGHFAIAEMVQDQFSARERVYKQFLRLFGS